MGKSSGQTPTVAVLMGGPSAEREVSLSSGRACAAALREHGGYNVIEVEADRDLPAERLIGIVAKLRDAGATRVSVVTERAMP